MWTIYYLLSSSTLLYSLAASKVFPLCNENPDGLAKLPSMCYQSSEYNPAQFPEPSPAQIQSKFTIQRILKVDENEQTLDVYLDFLISWIDTRIGMVYNTETNQSYFRIMGDDLDGLWIPELVFRNAIKVDILKERIGFKKEESYLNQQQILILKITCNFDFSSFPFDQQSCQLPFFNYQGNVDVVILKTPIINVYADDDQNEASVVIIETGALPFTSVAKSIESSTFLRRSNNISQAGIEFRFCRDSQTFKQLFGTFYLPSTLFAIISMSSFFIKPEVVPGRMGMIVTLFLILINTYKSVSAPQARGFSFIEIWYIGIQIPIVFAFLEYAIILASTRKYGLERELKLGNQLIRVQEILSMVDQVSFLISVFYFIIFNLVYWYFSLGTWYANQDEVLEN